MLVVLRVTKIPHFHGGFSIYALPSMYFWRMRCLRLYLVVVLCWNAGGPLRSQTLGGQSTFSFLRLPSYPLLNALGGVNTSVITEDPAVAAHNPALLRFAHHGLMTASFNAHPAGVRQLGWMMTAASARQETVFSAGVDFFDYGKATGTDAIGNILGAFSAYDMAVRISAGRRYLDHWYYGVSFKGAFSQYGIYRSVGILGDVGVNYLDSARGLQLGILFRNMGGQVQVYDREGEDMPFDVQLGITKRLQYAPLQFSLSAHRLHRFDILYRDTLYQSDNEGRITGGGIPEKVLRHLVLSVQGFVGERIDLTLGYSFMRRAELGIAGAANGMSGFSVGAGVSLRRLKLRYAHSVYRPGAAFSQFAITADLSRHGR